MIPIVAEQVATVGEEAEVAAPIAVEPRIEVRPRAEKPPVPANSLVYSGETGVSRPAAQPADAQDFVTVLGEEAKNPRVPGWLVSLLVMLSLLLVGVATLFYLMPRAAEGETTKAVATAPSSPGPGVSPLHRCRCLYSIRC